MNLNIKKYFNIGPSYINSFGYGLLLKFKFYDPITETQSINLYFCLWKYKPSRNFKSITGSKAVYFPFNIEGIKQVIYKKDDFY